MTSRTLTLTRAEARLLASVLHGEIDAAHIYKRLGGILNSHHYIVKVEKVLAKVKEVAR